MMTVPEDLPSAGFLSELDPSVRRRLIARGKFESMEAETYLVKQGDDDDNLSVLVEGKLAVSCHSNGNRVELAELDPGADDRRDERPRSPAE